MIKIYDDLLTVEESNHIESFLRDPKFPWFLSNNENHHTTDIKNVNQNKNQFSKESILLGHTFYLDSLRNSDNFILSDFVLDRFLDRSNTSFNSLIRSKANLQIAMPSNKDYLYTSPHIDSIEKHKVLIYYVNDCDGDTFIFDNHIHGTIKQRIVPKKGRFVIFDGSLYHAAGLNTNSDYRLNINYNIT